MPESDFENQVEKKLYDLSCDWNAPQNFAENCRTPEALAKYVAPYISELHNASLASEREKIRKWAGENSYIWYSNDNDKAVRLPDLLSFLSSLDKGE